ncbi:hypothetical protein ACTXT7_005757 [Hymenolepis weldensis]
MDEIREKSMGDILPNTFKCLKEQQSIKSVVHQDLEYKSYVLTRGHADAYAETVQNIVVKPPWGESVGNGGRPYVFQHASPPSHKALTIQDCMDRWPIIFIIISPQTYARLLTHQIVILWIIICGALRDVVEKEINKHPYDTKSSSLVEAITRAMEDINHDHLM